MCHTVFNEHKGCHQSHMLIILHKRIQMVITYLQVIIRLLWNAIVMLNILNVSSTADFWGCERLNKNFICKRVFDLFLTLVLFVSCLDCLFSVCPSTYFFCNTCVLFLPLWHINLLVIIRTSQTVLASSKRTSMSCMLSRILCACNSQVCTAIKWTMHLTPSFPTTCAPIKTIP